MEPIGVRTKLGISSCLLGEEVRFDGGHKHNAYVTRTLARHFDFIPFCPEKAIGLPTPRTPIRLVAEPGSSLIRAVESLDQSKGRTEKLIRYGQKISTRIEDVSGYIVKKDSTSCGMERVKIYEREAAPAEKRGTRLYTAQLKKELPELPIEEEGLLMEPGLQENFITRVFTMCRWRQLLATGLTRQSFVEFHARHKFLILAHHEVTYRELGRHIADLGSLDLESKADAYLKLLMKGLRHMTTPGKHANVLMHIMGYVKDRMSADEKVELLDLIEAHHTELIPVIVPITLINHFLRRYPHEYVAQQYYLSPHPLELMLRNSI